MSKIQFLLHIHKKDIFLLPTPTEVASYSSYSIINNWSLTNVAFWLSLHRFLTEGSPYQNVRENPCFLLSGSNPPIA